MSKNAKHTTKMLTSSAILVALGVIIARFLSSAPSQSVRISLESIPIFLSGALFGPLAGAMVGFATDFIGCLFSPYGFNPLFCLPPILYGLCGGIFRSFLGKNVSFIRVLLAFLPAAVFGSILWQSFALDLIYGSGFLTLLSARSIQFGITVILDAIILRLLFFSGAFARLGLWPPVAKRSVENDGK